MIIDNNCKNSIKSKIFQDYEESNWVDLILDTNNDGFSDDESIETNILLKSSIKRLTEAKNKQFNNEIVLNENWNQLPPFKSALK